MFVELIDLLRCPEPHEDSWLVLVAEVTRERHVLHGTLACPVCARRYTVRDGVAHFRPQDAGPAAPQAPPPTDSGGDAGDGGDAVDPGDEWPLRLAAFLDLAEGRGAVGLYGTWARHAEALGDVVESVDLVAIAPMAPPHPMLSAIVPPSRARIPMASGSLRAVAVDGGGSGSEVLREAARLVRPGGRIFAPVSAAVPPGVRELARDDAWWIGERDAAPAGIVAIGSRRR